MPKNGNRIRWTSERRALHRKATLEGRKRKRRVTPKALAHFSKAGLVCEELRPIVALRREQYGFMLDDLGGIEEVTQLQRAVLDGWLYAQIAADAQISRILEHPHAERLPERLATLLNTARSNLLALGLERRVREVQMPTLEELVDVTPANTQQHDPSPSGAEGRRVEGSLFARVRAELP